MKKLLALLALAVLSLSTTNLHADSIIATLNTGAATDVLVQTPILNGYQFTYSNLTSVTVFPGLPGIPSLGIPGTPPLDNTRLTTFTATYVDALGTAGVLNVTDVCVDVTLLGPPVPCQNLAFSFTNLTLGNSSLVAALGANVFLNGNVANIDLGGGSVALGGATVDFSGPPSNGNPNPSPVPEPSTLSLMATGLVGAAGAVRRKFKA